MLEMVTENEALFGLIAAIAIFATILAVAAPFLQRDKLSGRLKAVTSRREELKAIARREAEKKTEIRHKSRGFMREIVDKLDLRRMLEAPDTREKLLQAGFRSPAALITFLFLRLVMPLVVFGVALLFLLSMDNLQYPTIIKVAMSFSIAGIGFFLPNLFVSSKTKGRQTSISRAFPDTLDLLLICVEAGMSVELAFQRVGSEIGSQSPELAEELGLTTAELSYLPDRRQALENLGKRVGLPGVQSVCTSLIQAERYGTPIAQSLRVLAQENRDMRMAAAEKKAASLPATLTVPMILFFLPVLFLVILGPAGIGISISD